MTAPAVYLASKSVRREELLRQLGEESRPDGARPDERHVAAQDVPELRQLVQIPATHPCTEAEKSRRHDLLPPDDATIEVVADHLHRFAERAWRRPVKKDELAQYDTGRLHTYLERDMISQINHNISARIIEPVGNGLFRYSWRGCIFLWVQVVKDMIRV